MPNIAKESETSKVSVIDFIAYPHAFLDTGERILIDQIDGSSKRIGSHIKRNGESWVVVGSTANSDCVNGVCPIR